jgi:hypothetical protein
VTPLDAAIDDLAREVVNALPSLWPKTVTLAPDSARVWVSRPDESEVAFRAPANLELVFDDGSFLSDLMTFYRNSYAANSPRMMEQIGLTDVTEDVRSSFNLQIGPPVEVRDKGHREACSCGRPRASPRNSIGSRRSS